MTIEHPSPQGCRCYLRGLIRINRGGKIVSLVWDRQDRHLYGLPEVADTMGESLTVGNDAEFLLRDRWEKRALALGFKRADAEEKSNG